MNALPDTVIASPPPTLDSHSGGERLRRFLNALLRWRYWALGALMLALAGGALIILLTPPSYRASSTIEIARETVKIAGVGGLEDAVAGADEEFYETQYGLLRGKALAQSVVRTLDLNTNESFLPEKVAELPSDTPVSRTARMAAAVAKVQQHTQIAPQRFSRLVDVHYSDEDPVLAARIANALVSDFIRSNLERRLERNEYARDFLRERIAEVRDRLQASERRLISYATQQEIISVPSGASEGGASGTASQSLIGQDLADMSSALAEARADRIAAEGRWRAAQTAGGLNRPEVLQNQAITELLGQLAELRGQRDQLATNYDSDYPPLAALINQIAQIERQVAQISNRILLSIQSDYLAARMREQELVQQVSERKEDVLDFGRRSIRYNILERDVDTNRQLYEALLQRIKEVGVANDIGSNNVSVVLPATPPQKPYSPRPFRILLLALLTGLLGALAVVLIRDFFDSSLATPEDVSERLSVPLLGSVPKAEVQDLIEAMGQPRSPFLEAYASIITGLRHTGHDGAPKTLVITSTKQAEGKSTAAVALAILFSRQGDRVLLVDADLRRPSIHSRFGLANNVGLSDLLAGTDDFAAMVQKSQNTNLSVLTAGPLPPSAADLLSGSRLPITMQLLLKNYDRVIFDAPPVLGLADAPLLSSHADGVLFVVETGATRTQTIRRAIKRLRDVGGQVVGIVLNKFEPRASLFDDYGKYGYYEYGADKNT